MGTVNLLLLLLLLQRRISSAGWFTLCGDHVLNLLAIWCQRGLQVACHDMINQEASQYLAGVLP